MNEAYKAQLDRMKYLQDEIRKLKNISGMIDVSDKNITLLSAYFEKVVELFDTWHFDVKDNAYSVWGYLNGRKYTAYPTIERLVDMLANHIDNFAKVLSETEPNHKDVCKCDAKTPKVEPLLADLLEKVFGKVGV